MAIAAGDLFPVTDWNVELRPVVGRISRPWQTQLLDDELPHVRQFSPPRGAPEVHFNGALFDELAFLSGLRFMSGAVVNHSIVEFDVPDDIFPVMAKTAADQDAAVLRVADSELAGPAGIIVFPELSVTKEGHDQLKQRLRDATDEVVMVAGSRHREEGGIKQNMSVLLTTSGDEIPFLKREPLWDKNHKEGIDPVDAPLTVLVAEDIRLVVCICKDFINRSLQELIAHLGANLVVVPSMTRFTDLHDVGARYLAARSHALTFVVNGPQVWDSEEGPGAGGEEDAHAGVEANQVEEYVAAQTAEVGALDPAGPVAFAPADGESAAEIASPADSQAVDSADWTAVAILGRPVSGPDHMVIATAGQPPGCAVRADIVAGEFEIVPVPGDES